MFRRRRWLFAVMTVALVVLFTAADSSTAQLTSQSSSPIQVIMSASVDGGTVTYSMSLKNTGSTDVSDVFIAGSVPAGAEFLAATGSPAGAWFRGLEAAGTDIQSVVWLSNGIPANGTQGPFVYAVDKGRASGLAAHGWIHWRLPADGTSRSPDADPSFNVVAVHDAGSPQFNGECLSCHADALSATTLNPNIREAHLEMMPFVPGYSAAQGPTGQVCAFCHRGTDLRDHSAGNLRRDVNVAYCAACHGPQGPGKKFYAR